MKIVADYISSALLLLLGFLSRTLNRITRKYLGEKIGNLLRFLSPARANTTLGNIKKALPELPEKNQIEIRDQSYRNLGITLMELLAFPSMKYEDFAGYVKYDNIELINEVYSRERGLILLSGHFGNWELLAYTAGLFTGIPVTIIVKPQSNKISDKFLNKYRTQGGNKVVPMAHAAKTIVKTLQNKEAVALLADQSADWRKDIFVDFFGMQAATYEAPAALALKYKVPIIMGFARRQHDSTYRVRLIELDAKGLDDSKDSVVELTKRHVAVLEENIRDNPGLWAWQHKRWKHDPPGQHENN